MATDLGRVKSTAASKYDALVASQLAQAATRIRMLDLTAGLLGFAALSFAYVVGMVVGDSKLLFAPSTRQFALFVFLFGAAVYLYWAVLRPLRLRVNPYYAARLVEQQLPHAKNSIVNWVDLHEQTLPPAIRGALGQRAAKDLARVDLDRAFSSRRAARMGGLAGLFAVAFLAAFFLLGPRPFLSLLQRAFNPFATAGVSTRTQLRLLKPEGGDASVTVGRGVNFVVDVSGKVPSPKAPDAVKLLYRYEETEPWLERLLFQEPSGDWTTSLSAIEVRNGFWYKITGGDDQTEEYHVGVRATPAITDFLASYHFRPYVARIDEIHRDRELKALRGTEILLRVRTNRALRDGRLEFEANGQAEGVKPPLASVRGAIDPNDPRTFLVRFVLEQAGKYRLGFTSTDSEAYSDPASYPVTAIPDKAPTVELTKPGMDIRLPADALLHLEGKAGDDIGVKSLVLRMRVVGGEKLHGQPYRSENTLRLADGGYPGEVEYKDYVELSRVKSESGQPYALRAGMELEYWLEASDACDYPHANVAESKHYRVRLTEPERNPQKQQQEKQQSEKDKKQHEQKQDQKRQKENQERQQQRQEQQARNKEEQNQGQNGSEGNKSEENQGQNGSDGSKSAGAENNGEGKQQGDGKGGQGEPNNAEQKDGGGSAEEQKLEDRIKKALEKQQAGQNGQGEGKPDKGDTGEGKGAKSNKPDGSERSHAGSKDSSEGKDKGQPQAGSDPSQGEGKGDNAPRPKPDEKSEPKNGASGKQKDKGRAGEGKPDSASRQGGNKSDGEAKSKGDGQGKPKPKGQGSDSPQSENKPANDDSRSQGERKDNGSAEQKQGKSAPKGNRAGQSEPKPSSRPSENEKPNRNESQPNDGSSPRDAATKQVQDLARRLGSKDAREREQAKQQLERIKKEAADPQAREKAGEALKKIGEPDGSSEKGTPKKDNGSSGKPKEPGKEGGKNDGSEGNESSGDKQGDKEKGKSSGQQNGPGDKKGKGASTGNPSDGTPNSPGGNTPGGGNRRSGGDSSETHETVSPSKSEKPRDHRAAQMQLEDFAKRVNKDILKEAGVSEEAWKKYLASKRKQLMPREKPRPEGPSTPQQANQLPSMGGQTVQPAASGQGNDPTSNRGQAPPGYRDAKRKFTRQMSGDN